MPKEKTFKTFDEQIHLLESKKLKIDNREKLRWYLKSFNYQNLINGYNDFFMVNNDRKENKYKREASSNAIIELFNFDRNISKNILSTIQNIERMISTSLAYTLAKTMNKVKLNKNGQLFKLEEKNTSLINMIFVGKKIDQQEMPFVEVKTVIKKSIKMAKPIFKKYNNFDDIPIWTLILHITFGDVILFLENLRKDIFFEIMKNSNLCNWEKLTKNELITIFRIIKDIRNMICHNNVLYNINISDQKKIRCVTKFLNYINTKYKKINLFNIIEMLNILENNKKNSFLHSDIEYRLNELKINENIKNEIIEKLGYKKITT